MRSMIVSLFVASCVAAPVVASAQAERPTDREVKALIESIETKAERFEGALDNQLKKAVMRSATGETDVERYLDDFEKSIDSLKDRFGSDYSASTEALAVLRRGTDIGSYVKRNPGMKGTSEGEDMAADLSKLAGAYGTYFPLADSVSSVRRMNDREVAAAAEVVASGAGGFKKALESDLKRLPEADRAAARATAKDAEQLAKTAKEVKSRVSDGKPASAEVRSLMHNAARIDGYLSGKALPAAAQWKGVVSNLQKVAQGFGVPWPGASR